MKTNVEISLNNTLIPLAKNLESLAVSCVFGDEVQPEVNVDSIVLSNTDLFASSDYLRQLWEQDPVQGRTFDINISKGSLNYDFNFFTDYTKLSFLSDVETQVGLKKNGGLNTFFDKARGTTQQLLKSKGLLDNSVPSRRCFDAIPVIVSNRKTTLERAQLTLNLVLLSKTIYDELFKIGNIISDLTAIGTGIPAAIGNLTATIINLSALVSQWIRALIELREALFPPIRYISGVNAFELIDIFARYCGLSGAIFGTIDGRVRKCVISGSKTDDQIFNNPLNTSYLNDGIFNPQDFGYNMFDFMSIIKNIFNCRIAIINNTLQFRTLTDPFWLNSPAYQMPDVIIEQAFVQNGLVSPNYDEINGNVIFEYTEDNSDLFTLSNANVQTENVNQVLGPNDKGRTFAVRYLEVINETNPLFYQINRGIKINPGVAICTRKDELTRPEEIYEDLLERLREGYERIFGKYEGEQQVLENNIIDAIIPGLSSIFLGPRLGSGIIENPFFNTPKIFYLEGTEGLQRIPSNFFDRIGAKACLEDFYETEAVSPNTTGTPYGRKPRFNFTNVEIPFGFEDFLTILNAGFFQTESGELGKFTRLEWDVMKDSANVDFWIQRDWMSNVNENIA